MKLSDTGSFCVFFRSDKAQNVPGRGQTDICRDAAGRRTAPDREAGGNARRSGALHIALAVADVDRLARLFERQHQLHPPRALDFGQAAAELRRRGVRAPLAFLAHTTAYAYEAFRVDAMQYLHIPFRPEQLTALLDRATEPEYGPVIPVATAMGLRALTIEDIEYLECTQQVEHYHLASGEDVA